MKIPQYIKGLEALGVIGRPTSKEYRVHVEVMPDTFDKHTGKGKAVVNTPAGLGINLAVAERSDHDYNMVFWKNADGSIDPLYMSLCPYCPQEK